jgi:hypothetical protein
MRMAMAVMIGLVAGAPAMAQETPFGRTLRDGSAEMARVLGQAPSPTPSRSIAGASDDEIRAEAERRGLIPQNDGPGMRCRVVGFIGENAVTSCD